MARLCASPASVAGPATWEWTVAARGR